VDLPLPDCVEISQVILDTKHVGIHSLLIMGLFYEFCSKNM